MDEFDWGCSKASGKRPIPGTLAAIALHKIKDQKDQISVSIYQPLMQKLRWVAGDKVRFGVSSGAVRVERVAPSFDGAVYTLTATSGDTKLASKQTGQIVSSKTKRTAPSGLSFPGGLRKLTFTNADIDNGGITLRYGDALELTPEAN